MNNRRRHAGQFSIIANVALKAQTSRDAIYLRSNTEEC